MLDKLLSTPTEQVGKFGRFVIYQLKLWRQCVKLLRKNRAGQQAAALSYHTIFGLVPLAIVTLLIFQSLPAYQQLGDRARDFLYKQAHLTTIELPAPDDSGQTVKLTSHIDRIAERFFSGGNRGWVTVLSSVIVIWAALALLSTIERAFNRIYHVPRGRGFVHRIVNYWALLTLGPLLLAMGLYVGTRFTVFGRLQVSLLQQAGPVVASYFISVAAFFFLYFVLPNTKVSVRCALWGAVVAALVWSVVKWLFGYYVTQYQPYSTIYGVLGLVPLSVVWIYISWLIVLFGLQLTFTTQHLKTLEVAETAADRKTQRYFVVNDISAINIMAQIADGFRTKSAPIPAEVICSKLDLPAEFGEMILDHFVSAGLLIKASEPAAGFVPATEPANIRLSDISDAVAKAGFGQRAPENAELLRQTLESHREVLTRYTLEDVIERQHNVQKLTDREPA